MTAALPQIKAIANWYGSARMVAERIGGELAGCSWVGVPFAGGMSELLHLDARTLAVNDLHRHVINLARVMADGTLGPMLYRRLRRRVFHPDELSNAQVYCRTHPPTGERDMAAAEQYFVCQWMARGGIGGTAQEYTGGLPLRWDANGGGSAKRFHSAVASIPAWRAILRRCEFSTMDAFDFIDRVKDIEGVGLYCDPPFPAAGDKYAFRFDPALQRRLAVAVERFTTARVVMRFHDHPLIRELYPASRWAWIEHDGRTQTNGKALEVLIVNGSGNFR